MTEVIAPGKKGRAKTRWELEQFFHKLK